MVCNYFMVVPMIDMALDDYEKHLQKMKCMELKANWDTGSKSCKFQ